MFTLSLTLGINPEDVKTMLNTLRPYLIGLVVVLVLAVVALVACAVVKGLAKEKKYLIQTQTVIAALLAVVIVVNLMMTGPLSSLLDLVSAEGKISQESIVESQAFGIEVAEEGIVLLKNEGNLLPLSNTSKLNLFGWASTNPCYGGSGSGGISDAYPKTSIIQALTDAGFELNSDLEKFYTDYRGDRPVVDMFTQDWTLPEPPVDQYSDDMIANARAFSNTAVIVFARTGCENADLPVDLSVVNYTDNSGSYQDFGTDRHYLQLSRSEENLVKMVCENFENVVIVYNGSSVFELGFCDEYPQIKGTIWCCGAGQTGFAALGEILKGTVNPSGKTTDILVADLTTTPSHNNFMITNYDNMDEHIVDGVDFTTWSPVPKGPSFVNYVESIYVGYKFYETAAAEGFLDYDNAVLYPFGFGLSYTSFEQTMGAVSESDGTISFDVTVKNTGSVAGKDVVEVYFDPPYTNGGIEKASVNLVAYGKTKMLNPGDTDTVHISFAVEDLASYDSGIKVNGGGYIIEAGDYHISIRSDSHTVIAEQVYTVGSDIVYSANNPRPSDKMPATNAFDFADGGVTYLSRKDGFANFDVATAAPTNASMREEDKANYLSNANYDPFAYNDPDDVMPTQGAKGSLKLADLRGKDYDDPMWDQLLDQVSVSEMVELIALGGYQTIAVDSIQKVATTDCDGPVDIVNNFNGETSIGLPAVVMLAQTWNTELGTRFGQCIAKMADEMDVSGWYAPSMNMHRDAFAGRNFEYYSEDGVQGAYMAANVVKGAKEYGVYPYIKHFAMNDQETDRWYKNSVWSTEQAIREIYLKPFERCVKEAGATAVMSSYNYVGPYWDGACSALLQTVLRDEWGFRGMVITDYFLATGGAMNADQAIRNGSDLMLINQEAGTNYVKDQTSATGVLALRNATHNILYTVVNSRAYAGDVTMRMAKWKIALIIVDVLIAAVIIVLEVLVIRKGYLKRKTA